MARAVLHKRHNLVVVHIDNDTLQEHNDALEAYQRVLRASTLTAPTRIRVVNGRRVLLDGMAGHNVVGLRWSEIPEDWWCLPSKGPPAAQVGDTRIPPVYPVDPKEA